MQYFRLKTRSSGLFIEERSPFIVSLFFAPILRNITFILIVIYSANILVIAVYLLLNWDFNLFLKVGHTLLSMLYGAIIFNITLLFSIDKCQKIEKLRATMWKFDKLPDEVSHDIDQKYKSLNISRAILTIYALLVALFCFPISGDDRECSLFFYVFEDSTSQKIFHNTAILILMCLLKMYVMYLTHCIHFAVLFYMSDLTMHILPLRKKLQSIHKVYGVEGNQFHDAEYQNFISDILRQCILQHISILKYAAILKQGLENMILICAIFGVLCFSFVYVKAKTEPGLKFIINATCYQVINILSVYNISHIGQLLMDEIILMIFILFWIRVESNELHSDLCNCPWFLWDRRNISKYKIFLMNTKEAISLNSLGLTVSLNLLVILTRRICSFLAFIEQLADNT